MNQVKLNDRWTRSSNGWVAGVCQGIGERLDINPGMIRLGWLLSILFFGVGLFAYLAFVFCLPVEGNEAAEDRPKLLGVCYRLAQRLDLDVGLLRVLVVLLSVSSLGTAFLAYIVMHFLIPSEAH